MKLGEPVKHALDWTAFWASIGWMASLVPPVLGVVSLLWLCMQIYEWVINRRWRKKDES